MKPVKTGLGFTGNEAVPGGLLFDDEEKKPVANKKPTKGLEAAKNAAPKDVFCLMWLSSDTIEEVVGKLGEAGFSGNENSVKSRAKRIRSAKHSPMELPHLAGEPKALKNWKRVQAALAARKLGDKNFAQCELDELLKDD